MYIIYIYSKRKITEFVKNQFRTFVQKHYKIIIFKVGK